MNQHTSKDGISMQESLFMFMELEIKQQEGIAWGTMIGAYGACYAIRSELFPQIPSNFLVEDFYITMKVLEQSKKTVLSPDSVVYLNVPNKPGEEFRRKVRIAKGNYQNMNVFWHLLWPPYTGLAFSYFSHKVLRWLGPFFIVLCFASSIALSIRSEFYLFLLVLQIGLFVLPFIDLFLRKFNKHMLILRFITHFISMNAALFVGFVQYLKGVNTNTWEPTRRD
jgi:cellulose synthase/poly-beta-1,6-N-acetylglucosamine synthase-like glycosyltransferase